MMVLHCLSYAALHRHTRLSFASRLAVTMRFPYFLPIKPYCNSLSIHSALPWYFWSSDPIHFACALPPGVDKYFDQLGNDAVLLQTFYIRSSDYLLGEKDKMDFARDRSTYSNHHGYYHNRIMEYQQQFGYYDIFLVDPDNR